MTISHLKKLFRRLTATFLITFCSAALVTDSYATPATTTSITLKVGPTRTLKMPSDAAKVARTGDIIEIDAGLYPNDSTYWFQDNLTIRGVGGMAHIKTQKNIPNNKGIWVIRGDNLIIENIEFSGARVADTNGAGIRHEGGDLSLRNTYFHHNEFSILTGKNTQASLDIRDSRFWFQKRPKRFSHGIYIGTLKRFTLVGSHIKGTDRGHQLKSRALENHIRYNRIEDVPEGNSSRLIDLPNCGLSFIVGNDMHQGPATENVDAVGYGAEGCDHLDATQRELYVINNTLVNEAWGGSLVRNHVGAAALVTNNVIYGAGNFLLGKGRDFNNSKLNLTRWQRGSWLPLAGSDAVDTSLAPEPVHGVSLVPVRVFHPPIGTEKRSEKGPLDQGSRELP